MWHRFPRLSLVVILDRTGNIRRSSGVIIIRKLRERQSVTAAIGHTLSRKHGRWLPKVNHSCGFSFFLFNPPPPPIPSQPAAASKSTQVLICQAFGSELSPMFLFPSWGSGFKLHVISVKDFWKRTCTVGSAPCQARRGAAFAPEDTEPCSRSHEVCHEEWLITQFTPQIGCNISTDLAYLHFNYNYYLFLYFGCDHSEPNSSPTLERSRMTVSHWRFRCLFITFKYHHLCWNPLSKEPFTCWNKFKLKFKSLFAFLQPFFKIAASF